MKELNKQDYIDNRQLKITRDELTTISTEVADAHDYRDSIVICYRFFNDMEQREFVYEMWSKVGSEYEFTKELYTDIVPPSTLPEFTVHDNFKIDKLKCCIAELEKEFEENRVSFSKKFPEVVETMREQFEPYGANTVNEVPEEFRAEVIEKFESVITMEAKMMMMSNVSTTQLLTNFRKQLEQLLTLGV